MTAISRLQIQPPRVRFVDERGFITPEWWRWLSSFLSASQDTSAEIDSDSALTEGVPDAFDDSRAVGIAGNLDLLQPPFHPQQPENSFPAQQELGEIMKAMSSGYRIAAAGLAVLVAGTVTVNNAAVRADSLFFVTNQVTGGTAGLLRIGTITAGASFVINSASATDTSSVSWLMLNPIR